MGIGAGDIAGMMATVVIVAESLVRLTGVGGIVYRHTAVMVSTVYLIRMPPQ
jgi:hypothetical protein